MQRLPRPKLTLKIVFYAIFDVLGMLLFANGAMWFANGTLLFFPKYAANTFDAAILVVAGIALMIWAAAQMLRELVANQAKMPTETQAPEK